jgi:hypothetical protein
MAEAIIAETRADAARRSVKANQRPTARAISLLVSVAMLGACASSGHEVAEEARHALVSMNADDLQACAGIPNQTKRLDVHTELFSYEIKNENVGGMQLTLPLIGGFKLAGSGSYCHAIFRVVDGMVAALTYAGDNDDFAGKEGVCAPIVRGCLRAIGEKAMATIRAPYSSTQSSRGLELTQRPQ